MAAYNELTYDELFALPTHRLYAIYKLIRQDDYPNTAILSDKAQAIKWELDRRGHIPRKHENKKPKKAKHLSGATRWVEDLERRCEKDPYSTRGYDVAKDRVGSIKNPEEAIGLQVYKKSKKPFKSKNIYNTVKSVTENPHTGRVAFDFEEDSSIVDAHLCHLRKVKS